MASKMVWIEYHMVTNDHMRFGPYFTSKAAAEANRTLFGGVGKIENYKALAKKAVANKEKKNGEK